MAAMSLQFDKHVPIPKHRRGQRYDFGPMEVGDSVFRTFENGAKSLETAARAHARRTGRRILSTRERNGSEEEGLRVFRVE